MKRFILFSVLFISLVNSACYSGKQHKETISNITPNRYILFSFDNILCINPSNTIFKYDDADAFDYDYMAYACHLKDWYGDFVYIDIDSTIANEFICDYALYNVTDNYEVQDQLNDKWILLENIVMYNDNTNMFFFRIDKREYHI